MLIILKKENNNLHFYWWSYINGLQRQKRGKKKKKNQTNVYLSYQWFKDKNVIIDSDLDTLLIFGDYSLNKYRFNYISVECNNNW